jgi:epidermal growth factor receptor substrate 15
MKCSLFQIRLPFGRKKKQETHPPPPQPHPQSLSPLQEPEGIESRTVGDDVDAVKQLCSMGFSRTQAVDALEKYGYDMSKALNSLLGQ